MSALLGPSQLEERISNATFNSDARYRVSSFRERYPFSRFVLFRLKNSREKRVRATLRRILAPRNPWRREDSWNVGFPIFKKFRLYRTLAPRILNLAKPLAAVNSRFHAFQGGGEGKGKILIFRNIILYLNIAFRSSLA